MEFQSSQPYNSDSGDSEVENAPPPKKPRVYHDWTFVERFGNLCSAKLHVKDLKHFLVKSTRDGRNPKIYYNCRTAACPSKVYLHCEGKRPNYIENIQTFIVKNIKFS